MKVTENDSQAKLLRWAGSKTQSSKQIIPYIDFNRPYIEPFCGSASFYFSEKPKQAHLNDNNAALINFYRFLNSDPIPLWRRYTNYGTQESDYYKIRQRYNEMKDGLDKAAMFLYLNHNCFNGLYRTNQSGGFNTPFNKSLKRKKKLTRGQILKFSNELEGATTYCLDFEEFLSFLRPEGACIFIDPPYFTKDSRTFSEYGASVFCSRDLERLHRVALSLAEKNKVVITYKNCTEFRFLFESHIKSSIQIVRNIGGFSGRRKRDEEIVAVIGD